jgi:hypothetical protein
MRDSDGKERLVIPSFWRQFGKNWSERFPWKPPSIFRYVDGDPRIFGLYAGIIWPITEIPQDELPQRVRNAPVANEDFIDIDLPLVEQHYGFPTNGLDLTFDIDVALYFATHQFGISTEGKGLYEQIATHKHEGVVYCFRISDPPMKRTSDLVEDVGVFRELQPVRPTRQSCTLPLFDALCMNEVTADLDAILLIEPDFDSSSLPRASDLFPPPEDDPFYRAILDCKRTHPKYLSGIVDYDLSLCA